MASSSWFLNLLNSACGPICGTTSSSANPSDRNRNDAASTVEPGQSRSPPIDWEGRRGGSSSKASVASAEGAFALLHASDEKSSTASGRANNSPSLHVIQDADPDQWSDIAFSPTTSMLPAIPAQPIDMVVDEEKNNVSSTDEENWARKIETRAPSKGYLSRLHQWTEAALNRPGLWGAAQVAGSGSSGGGTNTTEDDAMDASYVREDDADGIKKQQLHQDQLQQAAAIPTRGPPLRKVAIRPSPRASPEGEAFNTAELVIRTVDSNGKEIKRESPQEKLRALQRKPPPAPIYHEKHANTGVKIPWSEVKKHGTRKDLWMVLGGCVYDCTAYMAKHPGGKGELLQAAGKDGTELYMKAHAWVAYHIILEKEFLGRVVDG